MQFTVSNSVTSNPTEEPVEVYYIAGGYKAYINTKTLHMEQGSGRVISDYLSVNSSATTLTALKACRVKYWVSTTTSGTGTYSEANLKQNGTISISNRITLVFVYEP